jgi:energy-coupling factor transport system substrate-specific component
MALLLLGNKSDNLPFEQEELDFFSALASDAAMAIRNAQLFEGLKREAERNKRQFIQTIIVLGSTIEAKDSYTHGHTERVTNYSLAIARQMAADGTLQMTNNFMDNLYIAGLLHDIGKIAVPESILNKTGQLTEEEYAVMKLHTIKGAEIVKPLSLHKEVLHGIKYHHERYDGKGYPDGLKGDEIPMTAAIIAVADAFDAMTSNRPYRSALTIDEARNRLERNAGSQFDPSVVHSLLSLSPAMLKKQFELATSQS